MTPDYVETVWWILKQIWDKGLLEEDFKVVPYCPRCETSLSSHEQHQPGAYKMVTDPSVYVRFPLADEPDTSLLVWTTTPWTLLANMAAAVGPEITYVKVADPDLAGSLPDPRARSASSPCSGEGVRGARGVRPAPTCSTALRAAVRFRRIRRQRRTRSGRATSSRPTTARGSSTSPPTARTTWSSRSATTCRSCR